MIDMSIKIIAIGAVIALAMWYMKSRSRVIDDLVVNMVDVGEETV